MKLIYCTYLSIIINKVVILNLRFYIFSEVVFLMLVLVVANCITLLTLLEYYDNFHEKLEFTNRAFKG